MLGSLSAPKHGGEVGTMSVVLGMDVLHAISRHGSALMGCEHVLPVYKWHGACTYTASRMLQ